MRNNKKLNKHYVDGTELYKIHNNCNKAAHLLMAACDKAEFNSDIIEYNLGDTKVLCNYKKNKYILYDKPRILTNKSLSIYDEEHNIICWFNMKSMKQIPNIIYHILNTLEYILELLFEDENLIRTIIIMSIILCIIFIIF